ncbi:Card1-like endonuclease domain-containing protein [Clostridium sardiniense]|uniref:Card1-like endonuclease domain-containing protein n=1 Tax=Clostridium sardiniense TaxID=29369 RepID=UPI003D34EFC9
MKEGTLLTVFNNHNESGIILAKKYKFENIIVAECNVHKDEVFDNLVEIYKESNNDSKIEIVKDDIDSIIDRFKGKESRLIINLTLDDTLKALKLLYKCKELNIDGVYIDIPRKKEYWFKKNLNILEEELVDLDIEEIFKSNGNNIISHECRLTNDNQILDFAKIIYENMDIWHKYKQRLYDTEIFSHDYTNQKIVTINKEKLCDEEKTILFKVISSLKKLNLIDVEEDKSIKVTFLNDYLKGFIFKSGTWLEILTESIVKEINSIDDVKSGVVFMWNELHGNIKNELDVVAIKDSVMVCISCKDSAKYDENTLNELKVYSDRIGGENSKKILIATKKPNKSSVIDRAREMGIHLVVLDKDINIFKKTLENIINKITQD